jgi:MFS family permease
MTGFRALAGPTVRQEISLASLGCGLAPNAPVLIAARALQGVGGALLTPGNLALISEPEERVQAVLDAAGGGAGTARARRPRTAPRRCRRVGP